MPRGPGCRSRCARWTTAASTATADRASRSSRLWASAWALAQSRMAACLLAQGVVVDLPEVEELHRLIPHDLGIVPRRDRDEVARGYLHLAPVLHHDPHPALVHVAEM